MCWFGFSETRKTQTRGHTPRSIEQRIGGSVGAGTVLKESAITGWASAQAHAKQDFRSYLLEPQSMSYFLLQSMNDLGDNESGSSECYPSFA